VKRKRVLNIERVVRNRLVRVAAALTLIAMAFILMIVARILTARFTRYAR